MKYPGLHRALSIPAAKVSGTIQDVKHVVILMQENRAFDHYFGTLPGVRGFSDPYPIPTPNGTVLRQSEGAGHREPYPLNAEHPSHTPLGYITPHTWDDSQQAWNNGRMDQWLPAKGRHSLGYYQADDIPFQTALANAFTVCDAYHCSVQGGTNPNRLYLWSGTHDPQGVAGGPALVNTFDRLGPATEGYRWTTYPERLEAAGIEWAIYQDMADNYNDNPLAGFQQYRRAYETSATPSALVAKALSTRTLDALAQDVDHGRLPQVSWIIAPTADSEHPEVSSPQAGGAYSERVLEILTRNPEVWSRCVFFITYDENDCFFDHMPPPAPPSRRTDGSLAGSSQIDTFDEYHDARLGPSAQTTADPPALHGRAFGLGPRVPMLVVSPWSQGAWVNSQVFDHSSVIRFLEQRFGVVEPNISAWRRAVCGDLTSAFDFSGAPVKARAAGARAARALPYELAVHARVLSEENCCQLALHNTGGVAAVFHVYDKLRLHEIPRRYTVAPGASLTDTWAIDAATGAYDLWVLGPDGFHRHMKGDLAPEACPEPELRYCPDTDRLTLVLHNPGPQPHRVSVHCELPTGGQADLKLAAASQTTWE